MSRNTLYTLFAVAAVGLLANTGCFWFQEIGPNIGPLGVPIPVSPYTQYKPEEKYWNKERYERVPVLPPLTPGGPLHAIDPPSDDEVMRALEKANPINGGTPMLHEMSRNNVRIVKLKIHDYIDPPRHYPLIGPAQVHHCGWKCMVYSTKYTRVGWPVPHTLTDEDCQECVYVDHDHFHAVGNVEFELQGVEQ